MGNIEYPARNGAGSQNAWHACVVMAFRCRTCLLQRSAVEQYSLIEKNSSRLAAEMSFPQKRESK